jgi:DNA replication protein DnaC
VVNKLDSLGKKVQREVPLGGDLCERCSDEEDRRQLREEAEEKLAANLEGSSLPGDLQRIDFSGFTHPEAVELAEAWGAGKLRGLCLTGDVGVGKTRLAAAASWRMLRRRRIRWVDVAQLVSALRASFNDEHRAQAIRVVTGHGPAVFDDLDKVNPTEYVREVLFAALNARLAAGSPLLVTTNESLPELGELLGKPILSRLVGYCEVVEMVGPDRRLSGVPG